MTSALYKYRDLFTGYFYSCIPNPIASAQKFPNIKKTKWINYFKIGSDSEIQSTVTRFMSDLIPFADEVGGHHGFHILQDKPVIVFTNDELKDSVFKATALWPGFARPRYGIHRENFPMSNSERVSMNYVINKVIEKNRLDRIYSPKKKLVKLPTERWSRPSVENAFKSLDKEHRDLKDAIRDNPDYEYLVMAEKLDLTSYVETREIISGMSREEQKKCVEQLFTLSLHCGYSDMHGGNIAFIKSGPNKGKIAIFDTESNGLASFHISASKLNKKLGYLRDIELEYAKLAIGQALDPENGLPFDRSIVKEVADIYYTEIAIEQAYNFACRNIIPIMAAVSFCATMYFRSFF